MGPAISTIFFGLSAAKPMNEQKQNDNTKKTRKQEDVRRLIGDTVSVADFQPETRSVIHPKSAKSLPRSNRLLPGRARSAHRASAITRLAARARTAGRTILCPSLDMNSTDEGTSGGAGCVDGMMGQPFIGRWATSVGGGQPR